MVFPHDSGIVHRFWPSAAVSAPAASDSNRRRYCSRNSALFLGPRLELPCMNSRGKPSACSYARSIRQSYETAAFRLRSAGDRIPRYHTVRNSGIKLVISGDTQKFVSKLVAV